MHLLYNIVVGAPQYVLSAVKLMIESVPYQWVAKCSLSGSFAILIAAHMYRKQQILRGTKFLRIFDKMQKFSLLISMARSNMYCNLTKP